MTNTNTNVPNQPLSVDTDDQLPRDERAVQSQGISRRAVIRHAALIGLAGLASVALAACSSLNSNADPNSTVTPGSDNGWYDSGSNNSSSSSSSSGSDDENDDDNGDDNSSSSSSSDGGDEGDDGGE